MKFPTINEPFFIQVQNFMKPYSIPGLKNSQELWCENNKPKTRKKDTIKRFLDELGTKIGESYEKSKFSLIERPRRATVWGMFTVYTYDGVSLPKLDIDNQWQTIQESLMPYVVEDDAQFDGFYTQRVYTRIKEAQTAYFWIWELEPGMFTFEQHQEFYRIHYNHIHDLLNNAIKHELKQPNSITRMLSKLD